MRGFEDHGHAHLGHSAKNGCHRCWLQATTDFSIGKIKWSGNYKWLGADSPIREWFSDEFDDPDIKTG